MWKKLIVMILLIMMSMSARASEIPEDIRIYCEEEGAKNNVAPAFLEGLAYCESGFNDHAVNKAGTCFGLCQIYKKFHIARMERLGVTDIYDRWGNIAVAADLLGELFEEYEDPGMVLLVYGGAGKATKKKYLETGKLPKWAQRIIDKSIEYEKEGNNGNFETDGDQTGGAGAGLPEE